MTIDMIVSVFIIVAMIGFFALSLRKAAQFARMRIHARLDLYPMPREGGGRAAYGGSYMEEPEWWTKPRQLDEVNEFKDILKEMLFIKKLYVNQRALWVGSFAMHMGFYVLFGWSILLLISGFWHPDFFVTGTWIVGAVGFALGLLGTVILLVRRTTDRVLVKYTTPLEYVNLVLLLSVLLTGAYVWMFEASPFVVAERVLTLQAEGLPPIIVVHLVLLGIAFLYIPLSKMSHYVGKFFAFHKVLWDNDPNLPGSDVERRLQQAAARPAQTGWSASKPAQPSSETLKG